MSRHHAVSIIMINFHYFQAARTYDKKNFSMLIEFPKLNYSLLAELTTNIQDFIFMEIQDVQVKNKGSNVHYNGTATPTYYSTNNDGKKDRVVIDFGYLRVRMISL